MRLGEGREEGEEGERDGLYRGGWSGGKRVEMKREKADVFPLPTRIPLLKGMCNVNDILSLLPSQRIISNLQGNNEEVSRDLWILVFYESKKPRPLPFSGHICKVKNAGM